MCVYVRGLDRAHRPDMVLLRRRPVGDVLQGWRCRPQDENDSGHVRDDDSEHAGDGKIDNDDEVDDSARRDWQRSTRSGSSRALKSSGSIRISSVSS